MSRRAAAAALMISIAVLIGWLLIQQSGRQEAPPHDVSPPIAKEDAARPHDGGAQEGSAHTRSDDAQEAAHIHSGGAQESSAHPHGGAKDAAHTHIDAVGTENEIPDLIVPDRPLDMTGDLGELYEAFRKVQAEIGRLKEGSGMPLSELYALIDSNGFNSDWTLFLRLYAKKRIGLPLNAKEEEYVDAADRIFLAPAYLQRAADDFFISRQNRIPILETMKWAKENAPEDYQFLRKRHVEPSRAYWEANSFYSRSTIDAYETIEESANRNYDSFLTALSEMSPESRVIDVFIKELDAYNRPPPQRMANRNRKPRPAGSGVKSPVATPFDTPAPGEEAAQEPPKIVDGSPDAPPQAPHNAEAEALEAMERYEVEEHMRRIAEAHPDWAGQIARWAEERYRRQRAGTPLMPPPNAPPGYAPRGGGNGMEER